MISTHPFYRPPSNCQIPGLGEKWESIFGRRTEGYFVEIGAYDGENFSNTSCLSDAGWAGLYVEPIKEFADKCRARHSLNQRVTVVNCAASDVNGEEEIFIGDTLTTLVGDQVSDYEKIDWAKGLHRGNSRKIRTETLDKILETHQVPVGFDVLVVDVEGAEDKVIRGFDIELWHPKVILIELEDEHPDFRNNARIVSAVACIRQKIESAGYAIYFKDHINSLYVRIDVFDRVEQKKRSFIRSPRLTVGLFTFNRSDMLPIAVMSIRNQSFIDFELIISDNCSTDTSVAEMCTAWSEEDERITYIRQPVNIGAINNFLFLFDQARSPLFMWASDDDLWDPDFMAQAILALDSDMKIDAWMSHIKVVDTMGAIVREIPNLANFSSSQNKFYDLLKFILQPECLGKANIFYSVFRLTALSKALDRTRPYLGNWGFDILFVYAFLVRSDIKIDEHPYFYKRVALSDIDFDPIDPRRYVVPWEYSSEFYGALIYLATDTPYHLLTKIMARARYYYDVLYWRIKFKHSVPWRPSKNVTRSIS